MKAWLAAAFMLLAASTPACFGHGVGFEVLDPVQLGDREVVLEVSSSKYGDLDNEREIRFALLDAATGVTVRDVTYEMTCSKGGALLFGGEFRAPDGISVFVLRGDDSSEIALEKADQGNPFFSLLGFGEEAVHVSGRPFNTGGLYKFDVRITTAESFSKELSPPIEYDVGLSIPQRTVYEIDDPDFGVAELSVVTYYDEISGLRYDPLERTVSFNMPFDWSEENINETSVVHEELSFPKTFGDLLFARYAISVNGQQIPQRAITMDGFSDERTIVHAVLGRNDLLDLREAGDGDGMYFVFGAAEDSPLGTATGNGQFQVTLDWEPAEIRSGRDVTFHFNISDAFLKNTPVSTEYDLSLVQAGVTLYSESGVSADHLGGRNEFTVSIPEGSSGLAEVRFENLAGNRLADAAMPVVIDRAEPEAAIPDWLGAVAGLWHDGEIDDRTFAEGVGYLIAQDIVQVPAADAGYDKTAALDRVRASAGSWSAGEIDDRTFAEGIAILIDLGLIPAGITPEG